MVFSFNHKFYFFLSLVGCTIVEALEAATLHPARVLEIHSRKGVLSFGADADFILLNEKLEVLSTWIAGDCVYEHESNNKQNSQ